MKKIKIFLVMVLSLVSVAAFAQKITVKGTVSESASGEPIPAALVQVKGTTTGGVVADFNGNYVISAPANATLVFSSLGYNSQEVAINGKSVVNVALDVDAKLLDEAVVVAYGAKRKQDLVGSISTVDNATIANSQAASVSSALEGAVAGLQVISSTGQPGDDSSIYIRGISSLSASNAALIVVDGAPFNGSLSDINPADIESISVSKDAVSNSLYGARAAGGVIMITTKTGKVDKVNINFNANAGIVTRAYKDYDYVTSNKEFYELTWYGMRNTQMAAGMPADLAAAYASENLLSEVGNYNAFIIPEGQYLVGLNGKLNNAATVRYDDSFANAMFQTGIRQNYDLSASGGTDKTDYYMSLGYLDNKSYIIGSDYSRVSGRVNVNSQLKSWLKAGMNIGISRSEQNGLQESSSAASNPFQTARSWAPIYPVHAYDAQGNLVLDEHGNPVYDAGTGQTAGTVSRPTATNQNIICNLYEDVRKVQATTVGAKGYIEARFLKNFTFNTNVSYEYDGYTQTTYYTPTIGDGQSFNGRSTKYAWNNTTLNTTQLLSYDNVFGDAHSFSAKIGHEYYLYNYQILYGQKTNFFDPANHELSNGGQIQELDSYTMAHNMEGFFGMVDYNYASRYYLSASYRRDGTSRFLNRWGNFWAVGGAWRISAEPWMQAIKPVVNDLKIRASYGTQGNENLDSYTPYTDLYAVSWDGNALGYTQTYYGNPNITWESQNTADVGLDFAFVDRVHGSIDYYNVVNDGLLFKRPTPTSTGRPYNWENIGKMSNSGIELDINFDIYKKSDLRWTVGVVGAHSTNKILTLPEENKENGIVSGAFKLMEGHSRYEYFTYEYAGMTENGAPQWYKDVTVNTLDEDGNPVLDENNKNVTHVEKQTTTTYSDATKYWTGKTALPAFNGGLNSSFYYKGFDFTIQTAFQIGGYGYDSEYLSGMSTSFYVGHHKDLWKTFNPVTGEGKYPIWNANNASNSYNQTSTAHLVTASYFAIKNLTVGYSFPAKWMSKVGISKLRVYAVADNLCLVSARQGYDPRVSLTGANSSHSGYSPLRSVSGGIQLTF